MTDYPKTHPLWNRGPEWIAERAAMAVEQVDKIPHGADTVVIKADLLVALVYMVRAEAVCTGQAEARIKELESRLLAGEIVEPKS